MKVLTSRPAANLERSLGGTIDEKLDANITQLESVT
jgi:hypothetical protein